MTVDEFKDMVRTTDTTYEYEGDTFLAALTDAGYEFMCSDNTPTRYYKTIDDMLINATIKGIRLIDCLEKVDF